MISDPGPSEKGERQRWSPPWGQVALVRQGGFRGHLPSNSHLSFILNAKHLNSIPSQDGTQLELNGIQAVMSTALIKNT